jgi:hypothetical protein
MLIGPFCILSKKYKKYALASFLFTAQFNITMLFKIGVTFCFFEITLFLSAVIIIFFSYRKTSYIKMNRIDMIYVFFLVFALFSIIIAQIRIALQNLVPLVTAEVPFIRSIKSLNRIIVYIPALIIIKSYLRKTIPSDDYSYLFLKYLAFSGIIPAIAAILQFIGVNFYLLRNNASFGVINPGIIDFGGSRIVGLTNEASFYIYQLFFPFIALFESKNKKLITKMTFLIICGLYILSVIISLSRTGYIIYLLYLVYYFLIIKHSLKKILLFSCILIGLLLLFNEVTILNFTIVERFKSSFKYDADLSTIERYGVTEALFKLMIKESLFTGVGIYNYGYYIKNYLPEYMNMIDYDGIRVPSFNFILQLLVEFGVFPFFIIFIIFFYLIKKMKDLFIVVWFLFLFLFALLFQILNFSIPFLICLYPYCNKNENTLHS